MAYTTWEDLSAFLKNARRIGNPFFDGRGCPGRIPYRFQFMEPLFQYVKLKTTWDPSVEIHVCPMDTGRGLDRLYYQHLELLGSSVFTEYQESEIAGWSPREQMDYLGTCTMEQYAGIWLELMERHELLRGLVCQWTGDFICHVRQLVLGIHTYHEEIKERLGHDPGPAVRIDGGDSDLHDGACVHIITFLNGDRVVYKPRSLVLDQVWQDYLGDMAGKAGMSAFVLPWIMDCGEFGFEEYIKPGEGCFGTFYYKAGFLLGIAYALQGNDLHADNLIACGDCPVLVDLETGVRVCANTVFSDIRHRKAGGTDTNRYCFDSVLRTNLLPFLTMGREIRPGDDALASRTAESLNLPYKNGRYGWAGDFIDNITEGFCLAYDTVQEYGISQGFRECSARFLIRNTSSYHDIQVWAYQSESIRDSRVFEERLAYLEQLYECVEDTGPHHQAKAFTGLLEQEKDAIRRGYIPRLTVRLSSPWPGGGENSGISIADVILGKTSAMNETDKQQQCRRIRLALNDAGPPDRLYKLCTGHPGTHGVLSQEMLAPLIRKRIRLWQGELEKGETVEGIVVARKNLRYYLTNLPWNIMEGIPGLLPFLASWYAVSGDEEAYKLFTLIAKGTRRHLGHVNLAAYRPGMAEGLEGLLRMVQITEPMIPSEDLAGIRSMVIKALSMGTKKKEDGFQEDSLYYGKAAKPYVLELEKKGIHPELYGGEDSLFEAGLMGGLDGVLFPSFFRGEGGWLYLLLRKCHPLRIPSVLGKGVR